MGRSNVDSPRNQGFVGGLRKGRDRARRRDSDQGGSLGDGRSGVSRATWKMESRDGRDAGVRYPHFAVVMGALRRGERPRPVVFAWRPGRGQGG